MEVYAQPTQVVRVVTAGPPGPPGDTLSYPFSLGGFLQAPYESPFQFYPPQACSLQSVVATVGTPPTGSDIVLDILKNGTTIYSSGGNPTISAGMNSGTGSTGSPSQAVFGTTDYITISVTQVGSVNPGGYLTVLLTLGVTS